MSENCSHNCATCGENCGERMIPQVTLSEGANVKKVIAVMSGKGGVGKSLVTSMMATLMQRRGYRVAILDADITGPSIPRVFGMEAGVQATPNDKIMPRKTETGIQVMSMNLLLDNQTAPVLWRGAMIAGAVTQFWTDVMWNNVDVMFVDMPPGTGDVPLTVFQSLPIQGIIMVTTPQELVGMIVEKAVNMADKMNIPVMGIVENMAYFKCPDCGKLHRIYGDSKVEEVAKAHGIENIASLPIDPLVTAICDQGRLEDFMAPYLDDMADAVENMIKAE